MGAVLWSWEYLSVSSPCCSSAAPLEPRGFRSVTEPLVETKNVTVRKQGRVILDDVSVQVHAGELLTIVGPNGAGKTTLLRALMGLESPALGTVQRRDGVTFGYLPQKLHLDPVLPLTVARLMTLTHAHPAEKVRAALAEVNALSLWSSPVQGLSGGELQRVLLARAVLARPEGDQPHVLFLDEPTQGIDYAGQIELYDLIGSLRYRHRCTVVMISHDLHVVTAATDRVICLHHHVCCAGRPEAVTRHPAYLRLFGAGAAGHLAVYAHASHQHHHHDGQQAGDQGSACCAAAENGA